MRSYRIDGDRTGDAEALGVMMRVRKVRSSRRVVLDKKLECVCVDGLGKCIALVCLAFLFL